MPLRSAVRAPSGRRRPAFPSERYERRPTSPWAAGRRPTGGRSSRFALRTAIATGSRAGRSVLLPGGATIRSATSFWNIRVSERHHGGHGPLSQRSSSAVPTLYGRLETTCAPSPASARSSTVSASVSRTLSLRDKGLQVLRVPECTGGRARPQRRAPASSRAWVRPPGPGRLRRRISSERSRHGGDPREQLPVEDEVLAQRLACLEPVPRNDVAQRLRGCVTPPVPGLPRTRPPCGSPRPSDAGRRGPGQRCRTPCHGRVRCG